jgi:ATP-dependent helicase/nuclease subunit B
MERQGKQARPAGTLTLLIPFSQAPLAVAAGRILDHYQDTLPDLGLCRILVADIQCAPQLRAELLQQAERRGFSALLGPVIERLDTWLGQFSGGGARILARPAQELVLAEALRGARPVYADTDPWLLADQLLDLFEELTHHLVPVPERLEDFEAALQRGYGAQNLSPALQQEAWVLHTLWHAWHRQLETEQCIDTASARLEQLHSSLAQADKHEVWLLGFDRFTPAEARWLRALIEQRRAHLLLHGSARHGGNHPDEPLHRLVEQLSLQHTPQVQADEDPFSRFMRALFDPSDLDLRQRAQAFAANCPQDPLHGRLSTFCADGPEQEARAVALQVKRWLLDDIQPVGLITADRRLARRVRALLEASGIVLDDPGGWALSTTSAAATLERWLESVEEDFACGPLLDVLKSAFVDFDDRELHLGLVRRLEQDIILHENIARGLQRYRRHLDLRSERLPGWSQDTRRELHALLNRIDHAASPLLPLLADRHAAGEYLNGLQQSLEELGVHRSFAADAAGVQVLELLQQLQQAAASSAARLDWQEFRNWLGRNLERATFTVTRCASPVRLLTLEQSRLQRFGGIIVAACSRDHLPGSPPGQTFFNQRVRAQLGLPVWPQALNHSLHHFYRVLHSAGHILLTRHAEDDGEPVAVSPWLELLETFHANAYPATLHSAELQRLVRHPNAQPASPDNAILPPPSQRPAPRAPLALQPRSWSAHTHQRMIDCPYRFFAADTLGLKPRDEIREALSKSDYGSLIHRVLQAFHSDVRQLPGPWSGSVSGEKREPALALLRRISEAVFADAVLDNFQARSWLHQWLTCLPGYLDWLGERQAHWQLSGVEVKAERHFGEHLRLKGRIDRVDRDAAALAVVDYKTGIPPAKDEVARGEAVQLPSYALLLDADIAQLEYLQFDNAGVAPEICASGEALQNLLSQVAQRLGAIELALQQQAGLPAWGDDKVCGYCEFGGLCRRAAWQGEDNGHE